MKKKDFVIYKICKRENTTKEKNKMNKLILFSSSWVCLSFLTKTFSNSTETILFSILIYLVIKNTENLGTSRMYLPLMGIVLSLGIFTRFTFIFFSIVPGIYFLRKIFISSKKKSGFLEKVFYVVFPFILCSLALIAIDTMYFSNCKAKSSYFSIFSTISITPLNNLLYNSQTSNLALHGEHPRYLHLLVNTPLLYFPFLLLLFWFLLKKIKKFTFSFNSSSSFPIFFFSILVSIFFLSLAPHQEPRFLVPLIVPLVLSIPNNNNPSKLFLVFHFFFNFSLTLFFSFFHQAGIVPSLLYVCSDLIKQQPQNHLFNLVYFKTYMPPNFLFSSCYSSINLIDLAGSSVHLLYSTLKNLQENNVSTFVVFPNSIRDLVFRSVSCNFHLIQSFTPHVSTEHFPSSFSQLSLDFFNVTNCK